MRGRTRAYIRDKCRVHGRLTLALAPTLTLTLRVLALARDVLHLPRRGADGGRRQG